MSILHADTRSILFYDLQTSGISLIIGHADRSLKCKYKARSEMTGLIIESGLKAANV
jgi:hypothetical protein